jgi:proline-specific peptidase
MREYSPAREGYAAFRGFKTRFRVVGKSQSRRALLCIHGGPGYGLDYLEPLEAMQSTGRQVVFYDQVGCGRSDHPGAGMEWSMPLFLEELQAVRKAAGLARCHVLGHGWGGMLALEYALGQPGGLESLVLSDTVASVPQWRRALLRLASGLPEEISGPLDQHRQSGTLASPPCRCIVDAFLRRHLCRMNPWPECLERSVEEARSHPEARLALLGCSELEPAGQLATWDVTARLGEIETPTLVVSGRHDLAPPEAAAALYRGIASSEWVVFEHSAHVPHLEEPQRYLEVLDGFLSKIEGRERPGGA